MSRRGGRKTGRVGSRLALVAGVASMLGCLLLVVMMQPVDQRQWLLGVVASIVVGAVVALILWMQGGQLGSRLTDLGLAVSKLGRGGTEVRVRVSGNDEVTALGRAVQYLATDLAAMFSEIDKASGTAATMDPAVRAFRDRTLDEPLAEPEGFEVDGAIGVGSRGGLDYFGSVGNVAYAVSAEGASPVSVLACRMARDEIVRALETGANARKTLSHTNRVLHKKLPRGACAIASLIDVGGDGEAKLYQAGYRAPLWICKAGEIFEVSAEGLALGLDEGPVFEKGLRSEKLPLQPGVRLVQTNDAGVRMQFLLDLCREHSPKHTGPFMNLVLGALESESGSDGLREDVLLLTVKRIA